MFTLAVIVLGLAHISLTTSKMEIENVNGCFAVVDIVVLLRWSKITVIYEYIREETMECLVTKLHTKGIQAQLIQLKANSSAQSLASLGSLIGDLTESNYSSFDVSSFLVLGNFDFVLYLLQTVSRLTNQNSTGLDTNSSETDVSWRRMSLMTSQWLLLTDVRKFDALNQALSGFEHVIVLNTSRLDHLALWTLLRSGDTTQLTFVTSLGPSTPPLRRHSLLPNLSQGLSNRTLRVVVKTYSYLLKRTVTNTTTTYDGVLIDVLKLLSQKLNFSYTLQESPDNQYGQQVDNGQWNGMIGMLTRKEADLAVTPFRSTPSRFAVVEPTYPVDFEDAILMFQVFNYTDDSSNFFLRPFTMTLFAVVGGCALMVVVLLLLSHFCFWYTHASQGSGPDVTHWLIEYVEIVVAGLLNKAHATSLHVSGAGNAIMVTWLFVSAVVLAAAYSSQLTATLAVHDVTLPFTSMEELVSQQEYTWGVSSTTALIQILQNSKDEVYKKFYEGAVHFAQTDPDVLSRSAEVQMAKVLTSRHVYLTSADKRLLELRATACGVQGIRVTGFHKQSVFYLQKYSPYSKMISEALSHMQETGLMTYLEKQWTPKEKRCASHDMTSAVSVDQAKTAFYVLGTGVLVATTALLLELGTVVFRRKMAS